MKVTEAAVARSDVRRYRHGNSTKQSGNTRKFLCEKQTLQHLPHITMVEMALREHRNRSHPREYSRLLRACNVESGVVQVWISEGECYQIKVDPNVIESALSEVAYARAQKIDNPLELYVLRPYEMI